MHRNGPDNKANFNYRNILRYEKKGEASQD